MDTKFSTNRYGRVGLHLIGPGFLITLYSSTDKFDPRLEKKCKRYGLSYFTFNLKSGNLDELLIQIKGVKYEPKPKREYRKKVITGIQETNTIQKVILRKNRNL